MTMSITYHDEHSVDRAAMLVMRTMIALQPAADLSPNGRAAFDDLMEKTPAADGIDYQPAALGGVAGWWCRPAGATARSVILYLHGGAYVVGSAKAYLHFAGQISARAGAPVFVAGYALAPERPFPEADEDAEAAYRALADTGASQIAIAGDSAGGGLALVIASRMTRNACDGGVPRPVATVALSPWTDLALTGESVVTRAGHDPLLTADALRAARQCYLGQRDARDPLASPLYGDLAGLPTTMLHVGEDEILLDDAGRYAERLDAAGSAGELHIWKGMVHVFPANLAMLRAAREAANEIGAFLRRRLTDPSVSSLHR
jgi:acetyl esterase/lipase